MKKILMLAPIPVPSSAADFFAAQLPPDLIPPDIQVDYVGCREGGTIMDSYYELALAEAFTLEAGAQAEAQGYDLVCVNSMSDTALPALRSRLSIPVVGTAAATLHFAATLGGRFSMLTMWEPWVPFVRESVAKYGLTDRLASVRHIGVRPDTVALLQGKEDIVFDALEKAGRAAIEEDGAAVIVLGSTTMLQSHRYLAERLPVPVVNPALVAFKFCQMMLDLGLAHSRRPYKQPETVNDGIFSAVQPRYSS